MLEIISKILSYGKLKEFKFSDCNFVSFSKKENKMIVYEPIFKDDLIQKLADSIS